MELGDRPITLPRLRSIEPREEAPKLCGGDLHRARAPAPPKEETVASTARGYERRAYKKPKPLQVYDPKKWVVWTDDTIATMLRLKAEGLSQTNIAIELNKLFPQDADVKFTANAVVGKLNRLKAKEAK